MNSLPYPGGDARAIAQARATGLKPSETLLIVLSGSYAWPNPTVYARPHERYRWDWIKGLCAVVLIRSSTRMGTILRDIERAEPYQLDVIDTERRLGWLINSTTPTLKTVRHPAAWVDDWLGPGTFHADLKRIKDAALQAAAAELAKKQTQELEPDAIWT